MRDLAIVMPTRDRPEIVRRNLHRTRRHFPDTPIYVFDDASADVAAIEAAVTAVGNCHLMRSPSPIGPAGGRRRLIEAAKARWCLAIDDDCYPSATFDPSRWLAMEPGLDDPIVVSFRNYRTYDGDIAPPGNLSVGPARTLTGGASLLHRASVMRIGSYNESFVFGGEDTDLARRVWASGRQLWIDPDNFIIHEHVAGGRDARREAFYYTRNRVLLNVLSLPVWYGLPLGLASAVRRWITQPNRWHGFLGIAAGLIAAVQHFEQRRPLSVRQFRRLERLPA